MLPGDRAWRVGARTVHIASMGLVLGGVAFQIPASRLLVPIVLMVLSGVFLLGVDMWRGFAFVYLGSGVAVWMKLALVGLGEIFPSTRLVWYLAATIVASVGSHMPGSWRHYSFVERRVIEYPE